MGLEDEVDNEPEEDGQAENRRCRQLFGRLVYKHSGRLRQVPVQAVIWCRRSPNLYSQESLTSLYIIIYVSPQKLTLQR